MQTFRPSRNRIFCFLFLILLILCQVDTGRQHADIKRGATRGKGQGCLCSAQFIDPACEALYVAQGRVWQRHHQRMIDTKAKAEALLSVDSASSQNRGKIATGYKRTWGDKAEGRQWQIGGLQSRQRRGSASMTHGAGPHGQVGFHEHSYHWEEERAATKIQARFRGHRVRRGSRQCTFEEEAAKRHALGQGRPGETVRLPLVADTTTTLMTDPTTNRLSLSLA